MIVKDLKRRLKRATAHALSTFAATIAAPTHLRCPWHDGGARCGGTLAPLNCSTTLLAIINGVDTNTKTEVYLCRRCGRRVKRSWKWEADRGRTTCHVLPSTERS